LDARQYSFVLPAVLLAIPFVLTTAVSAQDVAATLAPSAGSSGIKPSVSELVKLKQNPVSGLKQIGFQANVNPGDPDSGDALGIYSLQTVWPFSVNDDYRLIWGNSKQEDMYPIYFTDATGQKLEVDRGVAVSDNGIGAAVCANKIKGVRACLIHDHFSAKQGGEDDHMSILRIGGRTVGPSVAWDLVQTFLGSEFSQAARHLRRVGKVAALEGK
ncbi:MAG: RpiB/LacA/LacB family sugar-phosphate isomerase, partial [Chthoniobacteraceae bacterium]